VPWIPGVFLILAMKHRLSLAGVISLAALVVLLLFFGIRRYGSLDAMWRRASAEVTARLPHPILVPTPLPTATIWPTKTATFSQTGIRPASQPSPKPSAIETRAHLTAAPAVTPTVSNIRPVASPTATSAATPSPTATPPLPTPTPTLTALPPAVRLTGLTHAWQTWNNCGPATLAMNLSYFGSHATQAEVAAALRPFKDDKNVNPEELAAYVRAQGLRALARVNGSPEMLRQLLSVGVPVLVETWYEPKPNDGMGHYRLLVGFDDAAREWIAYDSYDSHGLVKGQPYAGIRLPYDEVAQDWPVFNRTYLLIHDEARAAAVEQVVGGDLADAAMWARALTAAEAEVAQQPDDPFAWFNLGTDLTSLGRFAEAASAYDRSRQLGLPWRMLWYQFGPFRAYYETERYDEVIALADATLRTAKHVEELFYWRGLAQQAKGDLPAARTSWERALELNPNYADARAALAALIP
jgi:tetratricopeptide (TPR) repeat protein